jgi:hypothetical protein
MPQGRMTEEQAYALAKQQRKANDARRAGGNAGGFKGIETPGQSIKALENGKFVYRSGSGITSDEGPTDAPKRAPSLVVNPPRGMATGPKAGESMSRADLFKGASSDGSMLRAGEKKPIINMRVGMGNSAGGYNRANAKPVAEASTELLGSAVSMMQQKGKSFDEARQSMQTLETFKGLSEAGREYALANFDRWRAGQVKGNKNTMGNLRRASQNPVKPTDNLQMRQAGPSQSTRNLARTANSVGILD